MDNPLVTLHGDLSVESVYKIIAKLLGIKPSEVTYNTDLQEYYDMDYELLEAIKEIEKELHIVFGEELTTRLSEQHPLTVYDIIIIANEAIKYQEYGPEDDGYDDDYEEDY